MGSGYFLEAQVTRAGKIAFRAAFSPRRGRNIFTETFTVLKRESVKVCSVTASLRGCVFISLIIVRSFPKKNGIRQFLPHPHRKEQRLSFQTSFFHGLCPKRKPLHSGVPRETA